MKLGETQEPIYRASIKKRQIERVRLALLEYGARLDTWGRRGECSIFYNPCGKGYCGVIGSDYIRIDSDVSTVFEKRARDGVASVVEKFLTPEKNSKKS